MLRYPRWLNPAVALVAIVAVSACAHRPPPSDRWIRFDPNTQRYSIDAHRVPRGALLEQLALVAKAEVRPRPGPDAPVTAHARGLDLEALVALLLPPGVRPVIRAGNREVAGEAHSPAAGKEGPPPQQEPGAPTKPDPDFEVRPAPASRDTGVMPSTARPLTGPGFKAPVDTLPRVAGGALPKQAKAPQPARATMRLTLQFEEGSAPRLVAAQPIEGRVPVQRFVVGTFLYAVLAADGRLLQAGTFNDPLIERSYPPSGPHQVLRAKSGVVGISVLREYLDGARVQVVDMTGIALPRELTDDVVRSALDRGRTVLRLDSETILRQLDKETEK